MQSEAERIAKGLTRAQRAAILWLSPDGEPKEHSKGAPREVSFWALRNKVEGDPQRRIANVYSLCLRGEGARQKGRFSLPTTWRLTPLGLEVRAILQRFPATESRGTPKV